MQKHNINTIKMASRSVTGKYTICLGNMFLCDQKNKFWTLQAHESIRFTTHEDAEYIAQSIWKRKTILSGKVTYKVRSDADNSLLGLLTVIQLD